MRNNWLASLLLALAPSAWAADYAQAPGSTLAFAGSYQGAVFSGRFPQFGSTLSFDPARPAEARLRVVIPLASATTANPDYDAELLGPAFFASARFPQATYVANGVRALGGNRYAADGILTLRGVARPVTLEFTWTPGPRPVLAGKASVRRLQFGVGGGDWADTDLIPDAIAVSTRVVFTPAR